MTDEIELERTYLVRRLPDGLERCESYEVLDIYLPSTARHPVLRVRRAGGKMVITKKQQVEEGDATRHLEQTIPLTDEEFGELAKLAGKRVRKKRYLYDCGGRTAEIGCSWTASGASSSRTSSSPARMRWPNSRCRSSASRRSPTRSSSREECSAARTTPTSRANWRGTATRGSDRADGNRAPDYKILRRKLNDSMQNLNVQIILLASAAAVLGVILAAAYLVPAPKILPTSQTTIPATHPSNGTVHANSTVYKALSSGKSLDLGTFVEVASAGGLNSSVFTVSYLGRATVSVEGIYLTVPFGITEEKNGNRSRLDFEVYEIPLIGGNMSVIAIRNDTRYYSCARGPAALQGNATGSGNYTCDSVHVTNSTYALFNTTNSSTSRLLNSTAVHLTSLNGSSYNGTPCTDVEGYFAYGNLGEAKTASGLASSAGLGSSGNVVFGSCIADALGIPLTLDLRVYNDTENGRQVVSVSLNETGFSRDAPANMTALPSPVSGH